MRSGMIGCGLFLGFSSLAVGAGGIPLQTDLYLSGLVVYTKLAPGTKAAKEYGTYPMIDRYDAHSGLAPHDVDVSAVVNGRDGENVTVVLEIRPVVGVTNWDKTEGITDTQLLENSKTELPCEIQKEAAVVIKGRTSVKFPDIPIGEIIRKYDKLRYWPAELIFRVAALPIRGETSLSNNVMELRFKVLVPD